MKLSVTSRDVDWEGIAKRISAGDSAALEQFLHIFPDVLASFFHNRGLHISDAEDVAVSCVHDIALRINKFKCRGKGSFLGWVFKIARNRLVDWRRKARLLIPLSEDLEIPDVPSEGEADLRRIMAVKEAMTNLSDLDQKIIQLRYFGAQHSYKEIAELVGISTDNARLRHFRALEALKKRLQGDPRLESKRISADSRHPTLCGHANYE